MCEPATIAMAAMAAASTAASLKAQSDQTEAAKDLQNREIAASNKEMDQNRKLATESFMNQTYEDAKNLQQTRAAAADESLKVAIQSKQAVGQSAVSAATGGVEGLGVTQLLDDFKRREAIFNANLQTNLRNKEGRTATGFKEKQGQYSGRIAAVKPYVPKPIAGPNYFGTIAGGAGSLLGNSKIAGLVDGLKVPSFGGGDANPDMPGAAFNGDDAGYGTGA